MRLSLLRPCMIQGGEATPVTDRGLSETGALRCRLDRTLNHFPLEPPKGRPRCALHYWAGFRKQAQMLFCPQCNVSLCISCYGLFHENEKIVSMKAAIAATMKRSGDSVAPVTMKRNGDSVADSSKNYEKRRRL